MKIVFVMGKCCSMYRQRSIVNLRYLTCGKHEIEVIRPSKNMYKNLQEMNPDMLFMVGGGKEHGEILLLFKGKNVVTVSDCLKNVDVYIEDEPEVVLPLLADAIEQGKDFSEVPGITYLHKTKPAKKWNVNSVKPIMENEQFLTFSTRGCKAQCSFCIEGKLQGYSLRYRNIKDVIDEVKSFTYIPGFNNDFCFADCSFDSNTADRMKKILKAVIEELPCHTYDANFRPDFHKMADKELMELLLRSGLVSAFVGVESVNAADLELYNKGTTKEDAQKTIDLLRSTDCCVHIGLINLNPISTIESLRENVAFLRKNHLGTYQMLTKKLDLHDTPIKQKLLKEGVMYGENFYDFRDSKVRTLATILDHIDRKLNKKALELYSSMTLRSVKREKKLAAANKDEEAFAIVMKYEPKIEFIINNESNSVCNWFSNLLDMVEQGLPYNEIMIMSDRFLNDECLKIVIKHYKSLTKQMMDELTKLYESRQI